MVFFYNKYNQSYLTRFLRVAPALNLATFLAAILIGFPVCGLRPVLAALFAIEKEPKPTRITPSPFFNDLLIAVTVASNALAASTFVNFASLAIASTNCDLFIVFDLMLILKLFIDRQK